MSEAILPAVEDELRLVLTLLEGNDLKELHSMMAYHLGWEGKDAGPAARGKRIRPVLTLVSAAATGGDWRCALPAAAAIELIHNFSLIHDDIEDNSPMRRGRPTVWSKWGIAQAINTGDAMFTLGHLSILRLEETTTADIALKAAGILQRTCLSLTQGQHLDMAFESWQSLNLDSYWQMVQGKTAALIGACTEIGALAGGANQNAQEAYRSFGVSLGLAFQGQDDLLGIWGDTKKTGKSNQSDLLSGKKSLPVVYGLQQDGPFARRWKEGPITGAEAPAIAAQLAKEGAREYTEECVQRLTEEAVQALEIAAPEGEAGEALIELANTLIRRST
jgi:geranylgeranyl diphosphate synthase, type I